MATATKRKRRVVKGIEHGTVSSYTNYGCRCKACTEANRMHSAEYRERRFAGEPLCVWELKGKTCSSKQSRSYGNGLCWHHARLLISLRESDPKKARRIERLLGIEPERKAA